MQINTFQWVSLPQETRNRLIEIFSLKKSGHVEVENKTVMTDGYTNQDLAGITVEKMQEYTGTDEEEYFSLFKAVLAKIEGEMVEELKKEIEESQNEESKDEPTTETQPVEGGDKKPTRTRTRSKKKKS